MEYETDNEVKLVADLGDKIVSNIGTLTSSWDLGCLIGKMIGNVAVGGEDIINRVTEMMALYDISEILEDKVLELGNEFLEVYGTKDEEKVVGDYVLYSQYLIGCRIRGEYCVYSIAVKDAGLRSYFSKETSETAEMWYQNKTRNILMIQDNLLNLSGKFVNNEDIFENILANLLSTYGYFDAEQIGTMNNIDNKWFEPNGILSKTILDFDRDYELEMLVCYTESVDTQGNDYQIMMDMYDVVDGEVLLMDSVPFSAYGENVNVINLSKNEWNEISLNIDAVLVDNYWYIICEEYSKASAFADGRRQNYWIKQYEDGKLKNVCSFTQKSEGSSGFEYIGYKFMDGVLAESKLYYSEWNEENALYDDFKSAIINFFDEYGIEIVDNILHNRQIDNITSILSDNNDKTKIFNFTNKISRRDDINNYFKFIAILNTQQEKKLLESEIELKKITKEDAGIIAENYWKHQSGDIDEDTGYVYGIYVQDELSENMEYIANLNWLVDNDHWSNVDRIYIDAISGECRLDYK